jgi:hypothetical protein
MALVRRGGFSAGSCIAACIHSLAITNNLERSCSDLSCRARWMQSSAKLSKSASGLTCVRFNMVSSQPAVDSEVPLVAGAWRKPLRFIQVEVRFTPSTTSAYARVSRSQRSSISRACWWMSPFSRYSQSTSCAGDKGVCASSIIAPNAFFPGVLRDGLGAGLPWLRCHLPQSSSASRLTAGACGFLNLGQSGERPDR